MAATRVALVTGGNQGIGFEIVRQLCKKFDGQVLLAARSVEKGQQAVRQLEEGGLHPVFVQLDVDSKESIEAAREELATKYGRLDVLINNAGVLIRRSSGVPLAERARQTISTNYHGLLNVTDAFWDLLQPNSRVVHLSSLMGRLAKLGASWRDKIRSPDLTIQQLSAIMDQFVLDAGSPDYDSKGWISVEQHAESYCVAKIGVSRLAGLQAAIAASDPRGGILVNACCPGWVRTNMGGNDATRSVEEGANTPVYLALLPPGTSQPNGQLVQDRKVKSFM